MVISDEIIMYNQLVVGVVCPFITLFHGHTCTPSATKRLIRVNNEDNERQPGKKSIWLAGGLNPSEKYESQLG